MPDNRILILETSRDRLQFDADTGRLVSLRPLDMPGLELIAANDDDPTFIIQYLDDTHTFCEINSRQAQATTCSVAHGVLHCDYTGLGGLDLALSFTVRAAADERFSSWSLNLANNANLRITGIQFPFVVMPYQLGTGGGEAVVWPLGPGQLIRAPRPQDLSPDCPHTWQMVPENGTPMHYPGLTHAQFLAFYGAQAGLLLQARDAEGYLKLIKAVHRGHGLRLGFANMGDWPHQGERMMPYEFALGSFTGDWYDAADLYRSWSLQQPWAKPLSQRRDIPDWLLDSPPHVIVRIQGKLDAGPAEPNKEFLPYRKIVPLLEPLAKAWNTPLVPVIMSWERPGPWIYPDCFPPAGGDASLLEFSQMARERGWHVGTFCNGTRWVTGHYWSDYHGDAYFQEHKGLDSVSLTHTGEPWHEFWDVTWRPSYACCSAADLTRSTAREFYQHMIDGGLDWIQFFDQNVGAAAFACYAENHGHLPEPGRWMGQAMHNLTQELHLLEEQAAQATGGKRRVVLSVEAPCNEYNLQDFTICDVRVVPEGHVHWSSRWIPLYHYLYHECILIQGGFGMGPEPHHMPIRTAYNLVVGEIPGAVLTGDGRLLNYDTENWAPWEPYIGSNAEAVESLRAATVLRRGPAKDWLVYGQMQRPAQIDGIEVIEWEWHSKINRIPAVFQGAWRAPDGRFALVLTNWTDEERVITVRDQRLGAHATLMTSGCTLTSVQRTATDGAYEVMLPPFGAVLLH
ncbi:MAG: DUF6259 domain-containing protein [Anaerolineae bacterium]